MREWPVSRRGRWIALLRPAQWVKNFFVVPALVFSGQLFVPDAAFRVALAFVAFCCLSSAAYVWNDWVDVENDRRHPEKRQRPLPAGEVTPTGAWLLSLGLLAGGIALSAFLGGGFLAMAGLYGGLQVGYSLWLKQVVIIDVMALATGYVLRAVAGGVVIAVEISPWLIVCTFLLALFLGFGKRRHEVLLLQSEAASHRQILREYSPYFLDQMISVVTASAVVAYVIYTASPEVREKLGTDALYITVPFVLYGIFRYLYLVHQREQGGNPTQLLLTDRPLWVNITLWLLTVVALLYG